MSTIQVNEILSRDGTKTLMKLDGGAMSGVNFGRRNLIMNGDMTINQRGSSSYTINSSWDYTIDRYKGYANASDGVYTVAQSTTAPAGFKNSAKITVTTADSSIGSTQLYMWGQIIEAQNMAHLKWGTSDAETVTLSFWVRSSLTGTFGVSLIEGNGITGSYNATYTISSADTWEYKTITIAGDTSAATWQTGNQEGILLNFDLGCGSSNKGTANQWNSTSKYGVTGATNLIGTANATLYITGLQLEVGEVATSFEHKSYGEELALCQRYYEKSALNNPVSWSGDVTNTATYWDVRAYMIEKRATPTITVGTEYAKNGFGSAPSISWADTRSFRAYASANSTFGGGYFVFGWTADAELG